MRVGELIWLLVIFCLILAICGALVLLIWWLWRKITLPEGAPPPKWTDLSALKSGAGKAPIILRLMVVAFLGLLMSAPVGMIHSLIQERAASYKSVVAELSRSWGGQQLLVGPVLSIPYTIKYNVTEQLPLTEAEKAQRASYGDTSLTKTVVREVVKNKTAVLLPETLKVDGSLAPELRERGIYGVRVYVADLALSGNFKKPDFKALDGRTSEVHWEKARLLVNLSDTKAFRGISDLGLAASEYKFVPGTNGSTAAPTGFSAKVDLSGLDDIPFSFSMSVGGSQGFYIAPIAVSSTIKIKSDWPHPKYYGDGLPTTRQQSETGFEATWEVPNLVRNYPQFADISTYAQVEGRDSSDYPHDESGRRVPRGRLPLAEYVIGVDLFEPVFLYSVLTRAVKYAMMFISLTFLSVLIFEISTFKKGGSRLHLAQYGLIGCGLALFFLVLLAVSEQMPFIYAYLLASGLNILMIGGYVRAALRRNKEAAIVTGILTMLYSALYFILRMEEYSLISGTALLVIAMVALMHATRNLGHNPNPPAQAVE